MIGLLTFLTSINEIVLRARLIQEDEDVQAELARLNLPGLCGVNAICERALLVLPKCVCVGGG